MIWLRSLNLYAIVGLVAIGVLIAAGIFRAGIKYKHNQDVAETAETNKVIVEDRGKDEAEIPANEAEAARIDAAVKAALKARFVLDDETAKLLGSVK